ncbi:MAG: tetratricopeptide repeat protein [Sphingobacteriales bacterium]|nr:tetratricopeptide repeat protein [Sphingobacteriales bacterium]
MNKADEFAKELENLMNNKDASTIDSYVALDALYHKVTDGLSAPAYYQDGFRQDLEQEFSLGKVITGANNGGKYKFIRMMNDTTAMYRLLSDEGVNYFELNFKPAGEKDFQITDFYGYVSSETFSSNLRRLYIINLANEDSTFTHPIIEAFPKLEYIAGLHAAKKLDAALRAIDSLPPSVQNDKIILAMRLNLAQMVSDSALDAAVEVYKKSYPNDHALQLKLIEIYFMKEQPEKAMTAIEALKTAIPEDPYLDVLKAQVLSQLKKYDEADKTIQAAIAKEDDIEEAYWTQSQIQMESGQYDKATAVFGEILERFGNNPADLLENTGDTLFSAFRASPAYQQWLEQHPADQSALGGQSDSLERLMQEYEALMADSSAHKHEEVHDNHKH